MKPKTGEEKKAKDAMETKNAIAKETKDKDKEKKSNKVKSDSFVIYIHRLLKQVHPDISISKKSMGIMSSFVDDIFQRLCMEASDLSKYGHKKTVSSKDILTSIKLLLPGELGTHAQKEAQKALDKYASE